MRILYVTEGFPYPLTSGLIRHYHLVRGLSAHHEIHLYSTVGSDFKAEHADALRPYCSRIETFRSVAGSALWRKVRARAGDIVARSGTPAAAQALAESTRKSLSEQTYDAILLHGRMNIPVLRYAGRTPVVVDLCDAHELRLQASLRYSSAPRRAVIRQEIRRVRAADATLIAAARHLLFASARDRDASLAGVSDAPPTTVLPNGVDTDYWHRTQPRLGSEIVFSGAMRYPPNDDAAQYLMNAIMPLVWEKDGAARLRIVGPDPTDAVRRLAASDSRVAVTGLVADVRPHLESAAVYAAPLRFASGIQNKLLEAMAMELPVLTSSVAADGLRGDDGVEPPVVVADSASEFATAILAALARARRHPDPHPAMRAFVRDRFAWPDSVSTLERVLRVARSTA